MNDGDRKLRSVLDCLLRDHFADLANREPIEIVVGCRAVRRLGSVRRGSSGPVIRVNALLLLPPVPIEVLEAVVAHELAHIVHGFGTRNRPAGLAPHRGGIVDQELDNRGLRDTRLACADWCERNWSSFVATNAPDIAARRAERQAYRDEAWHEFLSRPRTRTAADLERLAALAVDRAGREPFDGVRWLHATRRHRSLSYRERTSRCILIHGLLAHPSVPECVILHQFAHWLATAPRTSMPDTGPVYHAILTSEELERARTWERTQWNRFMRKQLPI